MLCRLTGQARPYLLKPTLIIFCPNYAEQFRGCIWFSITTRLSQHQNELDVILDDRVWLVWFSEKTTCSTRFVHCIRYLVPNDWREIVEPDLSALFLNRRMQGNNRMSPVILSPRQTNIPYNAHQPPPGNQSVIASLPDHAQLPQKLLVVFYVPHLRRRVFVALQCPVGRRSNYQMHRVCSKFCHFTCIAMHQHMLRVNRL